MRSYPRDPYWTKARFPSKCTKCSKCIKKGQAIFYYPNSRSVYCDGECGQKASREFSAMAQDEAFYSGGY